MEYIYGIDETCKCPVIGTLPVCIVKVNKRFFSRKYVKNLVIRDSKLTSWIQRRVTFNALKDVIQYSIRRVYPYHMDENLVDLEVKEIIQGLRMLGYKDGEKVYIDLFDGSEEGLIKRFKKFGFDTDFDKWVIETKADEKYKVVSLASMISKYYNDEEYSMIKKDYDIGNGNPGHLKVIKFIIDNYDNLPWFVRESWLTVKRLKNPMFRAIVRQRIEKREAKGRKLIGGLYDNI